SEGADEDGSTVGSETDGDVIAVQRRNSDRRAAFDGVEIILAIGSAAEDEVIVWRDLRAGDVLRRDRARRAALDRLHPQPRRTSGFVPLKQNAPPVWKPSRH